MATYITNKEVLAKLPKASLITFEFSRYYWRNYRWNFRFRTLRFANARMICLGPFMVTIRQRWLLRSAESLHPEAFK